MNKLRKFLPDREELLPPIGVILFALLILYNVYIEIMADNYSLTKNDTLNMSSLIMNSYGLIMSYVYIKYLLKEKSKLRKYILPIILSLFIISRLCYILLEYIFNL